MQSFMKSFSGLGPFITLGIGFIMTCITLYGYSNSSIFLNDTSTRNTVLGVLIVSDIFILVGSLIGIFGIKKQKNLLIFIYQIFIVIFIWMFISLGIAVQTLPNEYFDGDCNTATNPNVKIASSVSILSDATFCLKGCQCGLTNDTLKTYGTIQKDILNKTLYNRTDNAAKSLKQCPNYVLVPDDYKRITQTLGDLQDLLDCTGWCNFGSNNPLGWIYRFSDVNNGKPQGYCYDLLMSRMNTYSNFIGLSAIFTGIFLFIVFLVNLYLCCHKDRKSLRFKERFAYLPEGRYRRLV